MVAIDRVCVDENVTLTGQALPADGRPARVPASLYRFETVKNPSVRLEKSVRSIESSMPCLLSIRRALRHEHHARPFHRI